MLCLRGSWGMVIPGGPQKSLDPSPGGREGEKLAMNSPPQKKMPLSFSSSS